MKTYKIRVTIINSNLEIQLLSKPAREIKTVTVEASSKSEAERIALTMA